MRYQGAWRLYVNGPMRDAAGVGVGDRVRVELAFDRAPRTFVAPRAFVRALALTKNRKARAAFQALAPSRQKEINRYLGFTKNPATLARNIEIVMRHLNGGKPSGLEALLRVKKS